MYRPKWEARSLRLPIPFSGSHHQPALWAFHAASRILSKLSKISDTPPRPGAPWMCSQLTYVKLCTFGQAPPLPRSVLPPYKAGLGTQAYHQEMDPVEQQT